MSTSVFAGIADNRLLLPAVLTSLVFWLARRLASGRWSARTPMDIPIIVLVGMSILSIGVSTQRATTTEQVFRLLNGVALFYSIANWSQAERQIKTLIAAAFITGIGLALFALVSVDWELFKIPIIPAEIYSGFRNLVQDTIHRNVMGGYLVVLAPLSIGAFAFAYSDIRPSVRWTLLGGLGLIVAVLVLTQSRGALIALVAVILIIAGLRYRMGWMILPASLIGILSAATLVGTDKLLAIFATGFSLEGVAGRIEIWSRGIYMIQDFPISGIGMGSFGRVADLLYPFFLLPNGSIQHAHNLFLQIALDLGIPGLVAWLSIVFQVMFAGWKTYKKGTAVGNHWAVGAGAGLLCSQAALLVHGCVDAVTWGMVKPAPLIWGIWGIAFAAYNIYMHEPQDLR